MLVISGRLDCVCNKISQHGTLTEDKQGKQLNRRHYIPAVMTDQLRISFYPFQHKDNSTQDNITYTGDVLSAINSG
jgi:hypothetical protein